MSLKKEKIISDFPFKESNISDNIFIRKFSTEKSDEFEWHQDAEDRSIEVLSGKSWHIQLDNDLPIELKKGQQYFVPKERLHRIIAGQNDLVIKLTKFN